jgi:hypothetical protein
MGLIDRRTADQITTLFAAKKIPADLFFLEEGVEVMLRPCENVVAAAVTVAELGLRLHYDGSNLRVITDVDEPVPEVTVSEQHLLAGGTWVPEHNENEITATALQLARTTGMDPAKLIEERVGTGADGRVTKTDVMRQVRKVST